MAKGIEQKYETVCILKAELTDEQKTTIHNKVDEVIKKFNGKLLVRDDWGNVPIAYQIENFTTGNYIISNYTGDSGVVEEIERHFKISSDVLRFMTVKISEDYNYAGLRKEMKAMEEEIRKNREQRKRAQAH